MQIPVKYYNPKCHDRYRAVSVEQPFADALAADGRGEIRQPKATDYRGLVVICSAAKPKIPCRECGATIAFAELYDCQKVESEWRWCFRDVQRLIEMPVSGGRGLFTLIVPKGDLTPYPKHIILERKDYE